MPIEILIANENAMLNFGSKLSASVRGERGITICLFGGLGAGKTTLARGFLRGFGFDGKVKSPTYTIVEPYELKDITIYHFDLYRLADPSELEFLGFEDYFSKESVRLIEWPEKGHSRLPAPDIECHIDIIQDKRRIRLLAKTEIGKIILEHLDHER